MNYTTLGGMLAAGEIMNILTGVVIILLVTPLKMSVLARASLLKNVSA